MGEKSEDMILWKDRKHFAWFPFSFTKYYVKNERLYEEKGLLSTHYDEVLLYRIIDLCLERTLTQKIFGTGTIILYCKLNSDNKIYLKNIKNPIQVKGLLSQIIEESRQKKNVVGKEFYQNSRNMDSHSSSFDDNEFTTFPEE